MNTPLVESHLANNIARKRKFLTSYQKAEDLFFNHGCINKTIKHAHAILDMIDMDPSLKFKARMGMLKELPVGIGEIHKTEARVKFIINVANELVKFNETSTETCQQAVGHTVKSITFSEKETIYCVNYKLDVKDARREFEDHVDVRFFVDLLHKRQGFSVQWSEDEYVHLFQ
ncbi:hypothetical protein ACFSF3_06790 [Vibrio chagasii]